MAIGLAPATGAALAVALLAGGGGSAGASVAPEAEYSALAGTGPTGLVLREAGSPPPAGEDGRPTFLATPPPGAADWPVAGSIRRLAPGRTGMSAWIGRSTSGGVCVLLYDGVQVRGVAAVYAGCSAPGETARGASIEVSEIPGLPGETIAAGVVPDGVTAVSERMADGSTAVSIVSGNAWLRVGSQPAASNEQPTEITGG